MDIYIAVNTITHNYFCVYILSYIWSSLCIHIIVYMITLCIIYHHIYDWITLCKHIIVNIITFISLFHFKYNDCEDIRLYVFIINHLCIYNLYSTLIIVDSQFRTDGGRNSQTNGNRSILRSPVWTESEVDRWLFSIHGDKLVDNLCRIGWILSRPQSKGRPCGSLSELTALCNCVPRVKHVCLLLNAMCAKIICEQMQTLGWMICVHRSDASVTAARYHLLPYLIIIKRGGGRKNLLHMLTL